MPQDLGLNVSSEGQSRIATEDVLKPGSVREQMDVIW